jgi:hypothetical protein
MVYALLGKLTAMDSRLKRASPERYACWLLLPSVIVVVTLAPAIYLWGIEGPFRVLRFPQATLVWGLSLPLAFFSYEGLVAVWRSRFSISSKFAFSICHLCSIALSLMPIVVQILVIIAIGGVHGDR